MAAKKRSVIGGVDTHRATHHAAIIDSAGGLLADAAFPVNSDGYADLLAWMRSFGRLIAVESKALAATVLAWPAS
uniref:hypothetical protein n=1 Tax=Micromonospora echinaurantiaca TaxID=47857 RepID=UPI0026D50752